jgi:hypothetical protein
VPIIRCSTRDPIKIAAREYEKAGDLPAAARACERIGTLGVRYQQFFDAYVAYGTAALLWRDAGDPAREAEALLHLAACKSQSTGERAAALLRAQSLFGQVADGSRADLARRAYQVTRREFDLRDRIAHTLQPAERKAAFEHRPWGRVPPG